MVGAQIVHKSIWQVNMMIFFAEASFLNSLRFLLIAVFLMLIVAPLNTVAAETVSPSIMEISFHDDFVSAQLVDVPLIDVLQRIKKEFGFKAHFHGDLTEKITLSFTDVPLKKCLQLLTADHSLSVATRHAVEMLEQSEAKQIAEIWVFSRTSSSETVHVTPAVPMMPLSGSKGNTVKASQDSFEQTENSEEESVLPDQVSLDQNAEQSNKRQTIKNLAAVGDSVSVMAMAEFSRDADKEVRQLTVSAISSIQSEESTRVLGQVLLDESDPEIRMIALSALGQRKDDPLARTFLEGALNDADEEVKILAVQLLVD